MSTADRVIVVAAVALIRDGEVLTVRKRGTSRFMLVGGKLEPGEGPLEAALRETREEVGVVLEHVGFLGDYVSEAANEPDHELRSTVFVATTEQEAVPLGEIVEVRWMPIAERGQASYDDLAPMLELHVLPALRSRSERPREG